jgi:hypothetical protein
MADREFSALYDYTMPYLPGAEPAVIDFHIRRVLRDFFKRTTAWRLTFEFQTIPGQATYQLVPGTGKQVSSLLSVDVDTKGIGVVPEERRDRNVTSAKPYGWYQLLPQVLTLYPTPDAEYTVRVDAAITLPIEDEGGSKVHTFPGEFFDEHAEAIAAGVISGMMLMPGKPWTKLDSGASYGRIFGAAIRDTRGKLRDGGQPNASTFTAPVKFGV